MKISRNGKRIEISRVDILTTNDLILEIDRKIPQKWKIRKKNGSIHVLLTETEE